MSLPSSARQTLPAATTQSSAAEDKYLVKDSLRKGRARIPPTIPAFAVNATAFWPIWRIKGGPIIMSQYTPDPWSPSVPKFLASLVPFLFTTCALAGDWPMWRGSHLDGVSRESTPFPIKWSATDNIAWKTEIPGMGHSSPIVAGDRVFVTTCVESKDKNAERLLICLNRSDGKILWQQKVLSCPLERKHKLNSYASSTPATDGKYVYVTFLDPPKIIVDCYTVDGKYKWRSCAG